MTKKPRRKAKRPEFYRLVMVSDGTRWHFPWVPKPEDHAHQFIHLEETKTSVASRLGLLKRGERRG